MTPDSRPRFLAGVPEAAAGAAVASLMAGSGARVLVLLSQNLGRAEAVAEDAAFYAGLEGLPAPEMTALPPAAEDGAGAFESECDMLAALAALRAARPRQNAEGKMQKGEREVFSNPQSSASHLLLATSPDALLRPCPGKDAAAKAEVVLRPGLRTPLRGLVETLAKDFDYDHEALCETPGQFAVRGGIVDVYPLNAHAPVRIDFFGDEIESLRVFDPVSQRSEGEPLRELVIAAPVAESGEARPGAFFEHLPTDALFVWLEPSAEPPTGWPVAPESLPRAMFSPLEEPPEWFAPAGPARTKDAGRKTKAGEDARAPAMQAEDSSRISLLESRVSLTDWAGESLELYAAEPDAAVFGLERMEEAG